MPLDGIFAEGTIDRPIKSAVTLRHRGRWTSADLNYLFYRQQVERARAASATSAAARDAHSGLARLYEEVIEQVPGSTIRFATSPASGRE